MNIDQFPGYYNTIPMNQFQNPPYQIPQPQLQIQPPKQQPFNQTQYNPYNQYDNPSWQTQPDFWRIQPPSQFQDLNQQYNPRNTPNLFPQQELYQPSNFQNTPNNFCNPGYYYQQNTYQETEKIIYNQGGIPPLQQPLPPLQKPGPENGPDCPANSALLKTYFNNNINDHFFQRSPTNLPMYNPTMNYLPPVDMNYNPVHPSPFFGFNNTIPGNPNSEIIPKPCFDQTGHGKIDYHKPPYEPYSQKGGDQDPHKRHPHDSTSINNHKNTKQLTMRQEQQHQYFSSLELSRDDKNQEDDDSWKEGQKNFKKKSKFNPQTSPSSNLMRKQKLNSKLFQVPIRAPNSMQDQKNSSESVGNEPFLNNHKRNTFKNLTNQIISFVQSQKGQQILYRIKSLLQIKDQNFIQDFKIFAKSHIRKIFTVQQIKENLWDCSEKHTSNPNYKAMRIISKYFLEREATSRIITSKAVKNKNYHLCIKSQILSEIQRAYSTKK